jgi:RNA polymerase sigma-70 factor (ECF subfamily)
MEEQLILQQIRAGDEIAFEKLFHLFYERLSRYAWSMLDDKDAAEEIVQDVFVKFWENRASTEIHTALRPYLFKTVHNRCLNVIRHLNVRADYQKEQAYVESTIQWSVNDQLNEKELRQRIALAMEKLPPECRKVFRLSRFEELSYKEIAEFLDISVKTVENQMGKALRIMRVELSDYLFWGVLFMSSNSWETFLFFIHRGN